MSLNAHYLWKIKNILLNIKIIILIISNHDKMHLWLYFKEIVHKIYDINAQNCMFLVMDKKIH